MRHNSSSQDSSQGPSQASAVRVVRTFVKRCMLNGGNAPFSASAHSRQRAKSPNRRLAASYVPTGANGMPPKTFPRLLLLLLLATFAHGMALAQGAVYKCTDEDGSIVFSDTPCDEEPEIHAIEESYSPDPSNRVLYRQFRRETEKSESNDQKAPNDAYQSSPDVAQPQQPNRRTRPKIGNRPGDCAAEQGMCIARCQGDGQCIANCNAAHGRCVSRNPGSFGQCAGDCASEQGICIANCKGQGQCIANCNAVHGRCISRCSR